MQATVEVVWPQHRRARRAAARARVRARVRAQVRARGTTKDRQV